MARADALHRPTGKKRITSQASIWNVAFIALLAFALIGLGVYLFSPDWLRTGGDLPVGLRSPLRANYAMDPQQFSLPPVSTEVLREALADRAASGTPGAAAGQAATLMAALNTPVPSVTPLPGSTPLLTSTPTQVSSTLTPLPTATWWISTNTPGPSPTWLPSETATLLPSALPTRTFPPFYTATARVVTVVPVYPTATLFATKIPAKTITSTRPAATQPALTQPAATRTAEPTRSITLTTPGPVVTLTRAPSPTITTPPAYPPPPIQVTPPTAYP